MPNWCDTTYKCVGDPKEVRELHEVLERMNNRKDPQKQSDFGYMWLGELVNELGFDWEKYRCRGEITSYDYDGEGMVTINQMTAWCEQEGVRQVIQEKYPSIKVYYMEEEPGCDVYYTNDFTGDFFPEKYLLDGEDVYEYFETLEDVCEYVNNKFGLTTTPVLQDIEMQIEAYQEDNNIDYLNLHEFKYVED